MTVLEVIRKSADFFACEGIDSPRLQIELLLAHALGVPRLQLYMNFERSLTEKELAKVRDWVRRRARCEPLQHIVGSTSFCGLELKVTPQALIPRPETELLAEMARRHLAGLSFLSPVALDFGTGSGCIAIAIAACCAGAEIHALDISPEAIELARENAALNHVQDRVRFHTGDGFEALPPGLAFDLIVSNPPYIATKEIDTLQREVRDHDPRVALDGGSDGLDFFRRLATGAAAFLREDGRMMLEFGDGQAEQLRRIFVEYKWVVENVESDYNDKPRVLTVQRG